MRAPSNLKRPESRDADGAEHPAGEETRAADDQTIPVCLGEFGIKEAARLCPLWEATWSQDARSRTGNK